MTLDRDGLEQAIVRHCSPTLMGIKPACLFNVPGDFAPSTATGQRASRLDAIVGRANARLAGTGVHVRVLARRSCGALVLVYRPQMLARGLSSSRVAAALNDWGYKTTGPGWLEASLTRLGHRLECRQTHGPDGGFPHEVGLFLGYPYDDVMAFIEHEGRDYLCCGCWKVYSHREQAEACFERYKRCTRDCEEMLGHGATLAQLAVTRVAA